MNFVIDGNELTHEVYIAPTTQGTTGWTMCYQQFLTYERPDIPVMDYVKAEYPTCLACAVVVWVTWPKVVRL